MLELGNRRVPLLSAEVHFWRHDPGCWDPLLSRVAAEGIPIVSTYLSWRRHEPAAGEIDLEGRTDARLDLRRFMDLCVRHGLVLQLKPGPWICAEEPGGGYPDWLLENRDVWELDADGKPVLGYNPPFQHPVPCYLHPLYQQAAQHWLAAVAKHVCDLVWPDGPLALVQLDNEPSHCFRDGPGEAGHHPLTLAAFGGRQPDWASFQAWLLAEHLGRLRAVLVEAGLQDVIFTVNYNDHPVPTVPQDPAVLRSAVRGVGGPDLYYVPPLKRTDLTRLALWVALVVAGEPLPWAPEIQAGIWRSPGIPQLGPDPTPAEQCLWYLAALAFGLRGLNFYMLADRENWALAPLDQVGNAGPFLEGVRTAAQVINSFPDWGSMRPLPSVALAWPMAELRAAWAGRGRADHQTLATFSRLLDDGHVVRIWDGHGSSPPGLPLVDPLAPVSRAIDAALPVAASGGAIAVLQQGERSRALFVLNPTTRAMRVGLRFCDPTLDARLVPVAETGSAATIRGGVAELQLAPMQGCVYRLESADV
jgi:hypothetical protein